MIEVRACALPSKALLQRYAPPAGYADCFAAELPREVSQAHFVEAFYTSSVFKLERWILRVAASRPSTDTDATRLAQGEASTFAAWRVEAREADQLLMCDFTGRTRSWLMVEGRPGGVGTRLYFGSGIVPRQDPKTGEQRMGPLFNALLGFHKLYSRVLLRAAASRF